MSETVTAVVETKRSAVAAVAALEREGVARRVITVMSDEPFQSGEHDQSAHGRSLIGMAAVVGGFVGAGIGLLLTTWTSRRVNLVTGGMPIVSPWAFGVIVFELTALGAILSTLGRMIVEAGLFGPAKTEEVGDAVVNGKVVVSVEIADDIERQAVEQVFAHYRSA